MPKFNPGDHAALRLVIDFHFDNEYDIKDEHIDKIRKYIVSYLRRHCVIKRSN